jgi:predicted Zn finger-like uncharacterized protein
MRFSCDSCGAQYMISDDKVGPGGVKVRCKRCGQVVLVRPAAGAAPVVEPAPQAQPGPPAPSEGASRAAETGLDAELGLAFDSVFGGGGAPAPAPEAAPEQPAPPAGETAPEAPAPAGEVEWYVAIGDRQVGPLLAAGVKSRWEAGEVGPDTLVWRAGLADWSPLSGVAELTQLVSPIPRPSARAAPRPSEAAQTPEPSRTPAPEKAREPEPGWKPAAASALAKLASEEMASMAKPAEAPQAASGGPAGGSLVEKMQLPEGGVDPTGMLPLHLKGVDTTGETLLSGKKGESTEVRQLRKSTNRRLVAAVVAITAIFGGALAYVMYSMTSEKRGGAPAVAVAPPAPAGATAPAPSPAPPAPATAATPSAAAAAAGTPAAAPTPPPGAAAPAPGTPAPPPAAAPPAAVPPAATAAAPPAEPPRASPPAKEAPSKGARTAKKTKPARKEPERRVAAAAPAKKPAGDPLLDVGSDDELTKDLAGGGKKRSVYVPPPPGSDLPDRVSDPQIIEAIVGKKTSLQACVEEQKAAGGDARGPLMLRWTILPDGSVKDVRSISEGLARQPIVPCITSVVKSTRFPRTRLGREVEAFPFKF